MENWTFEAIGTRWQITTDVPLNVDQKQAVLKLSERFTADWSRFCDQSAIMQLSRGKGEIPLPADGSAMLEAYRELSLFTRGAVNPLVGDLLAHRGYDAVYSFTDRGAISVPTNWESILSWDDESLSANEPVTIDVGALGKGRLVDQIAQLLAPDFQRWVVDASGDVRCGGIGQTIGLESPFADKTLVGTWEIYDEALCASATNRRAWQGIHHVMDARTGEPAEGIVATWAKHPSAMTADAVATALFFDGGPELAAEWETEWFRIFADGSAQWSPNSTVKVFGPA